MNEGQVFGEEVKASSSNKTVGLILSVLIGAVVLVATTVAIVFAFFIPTKVVIEENNTLTGTPTPIVTMETVTPTPTPEETAMVIGTAKTNPSYKLKVGKSTVTIPAGWYVSAISSNVEAMKTEDRKMYLKPEYLDGDASIPIHRGGLLVITNGKSIIKITHNFDIIPGGWGFIPSEVPSDWTIVVKPIGFEGVGFARKKTGSSYTYEPVYSCGPVIQADDPCQKYGLVDVGVDPQMTFTGNDGDLKIADEFYKSSLLKKDFSFSAL